jgi:hypothetical protein
MLTDDKFRWRGELVVLAVRQSGGGQCHVVAVVLRIWTRTK